MVHLAIGPAWQKNRRIKQDGDGIALIEEDPSFGGQAPEPGSWNAKWIWLDQDTFSDFQDSPVNMFCPAPFGLRVVAMFRKKFELDFEPSRCDSWISADCKYRVYINGCLVGRGPAEVGGDYADTSPPAWWFFDRYEVGSLLKKGTNVITAEVLQYPEVGADHSMGHGGFLFQAKIVSNNDDRVKSCDIISDASWLAIVNDAALVKAMYNAMDDPGDWHDATYDESKWLPVLVLCDATRGRWKLIPRMIPPLMEVECTPAIVHSSDPALSRGRVLIGKRVPTHQYSGATPRSIVVVPGDHVSIDLEFEREMVGFLQFCINSPARVQLAFHFQEIRGKDDDGENYLTKDGWQCFESYRMRGFQFLRIDLDFSNAEDPKRPLEIVHLGVNFVSFPVHYIGDFTCSDPTLNRIWRVGRWTDQLCMQSYHLDSPIHQEPLADMGDYMIEALISYYCFGEYRLARQDLLKIAYQFRKNKYANFHTSYSLLWVRMLAEYYQYTGDIGLVRECLPDVHALLELFHAYVGSTGLVTEAPNYMFLDWGTVDGFNLHHPPGAIGQGYLSAFYYQALLDAIFLSQGCNLVNHVPSYQARARKVADAFNRELWAPDKMLYMDGLPGATRVKPNQWLPADPPKGKRFFSIHTNAIAVAVGICPEGRRLELMRRVLDTKGFPLVQPYFMHFLFKALLVSGIFDERGISEILRWKGLIDEHPTSWKEGWNFGDYSHAWSGTPTYQLSAIVLGIAPLVAGWTTVLIHSHPSSLSWVKGIVPTPLGDIQASWKRNSDEYQLGLTIPGKMQAAIVFAGESSMKTSIYEGGSLLWFDGKLQKEWRGISVLDPKKHQDLLAGFSSIKEPNLILLIQSGTYRFMSNGTPMVI
jgi:alpha-L-rhamnosidase